MTNTAPIMVNTNNYGTYDEFITNIQSANLNFIRSSAVYGGHLNLANYSIPFLYTVKDVDGITTGDILVTPDGEVLNIDMILANVDEEIENRNELPSNPTV